MKLLLIGRYSSSKILTGPEKVALNLCLSLDNRGLDPTFLTYYFKDLNDSTTFTRLFGTKVLSKKPLIIRYGLIKILIYLLFERPHVIHIITFERFLLPIIFFAKILRIKIVYTIHGIYRYEREIFYKKQCLFSEFKDLIIENLIFRYSDSLVFLSPQIIKLAENYYKIRKYKVSIIPNGVPLQNFSVNKIFDFSNSIKIVFYNGLDNSRRRGLEDLINILSKEKLSSYHLSILGDPINMNYNQINFISPLPENLLFKFFKDKHVFIDNLKYMPFSIMALEALSLGLILIVSNESGISSYIKNGENGFIFNVDKPEEIRKILLDISSGKYSPESISSNAMATAKELNWDNITGRYVELYNKLISRR